jgi:DNA/RNA-binding domain of Phe-tRNA-synthetase-like protein
LTDLPFSVTHELDDWALFWALLEPGDSDRGGSDALAALRARTAEQVRHRFRLETLAQEPAVGELRRLFRTAGTDPTRYRPSSEALLRRLLKGDELPAIHRLVDLNTCLSAELPAPCCVMDERALEPPFVLRAGLPGESYLSLRGEFRLEGRPLLVDATGPCDAPITGSERVKVTESSERAWLVAYLPAAAVTPDQAEALLGELLAAAPVAIVVTTGASG